LVTKTVTRKPLLFAGYGGVWPPLKSDQSTPRDLARVYLLSRVAALAPDVLHTLATIDTADDAALLTWAARWHLWPWVLPYARETRRLWRDWANGRGRAWSPNQADVAGELIPSTGRRPKRPTVLRIPARHFDWLVRRRVKRERREAVAVGESVDGSTIRRAIQTLEKNLR